MVPLSDYINLNASDRAITIKIIFSWPSLCTETTSQAYTKTQFPEKLRCCVNSK